MLVFNVDEIKKCLNDVVGEDKMYALGLLEWAIDKRSIEAIPIFDDATNGDMIKAMFPNARFSCGDFGISEYFMRMVDDRIGFVSLDLDWWNAPYKKESEECNK